MAKKASARHVGIEVRHRGSCPANAGGACGCQPSYRAEVWSARDQRRIRKTFPTLAAAKAWRHDAAAAIHHGTLVAPSDKTLQTFDPDAMARPYPARRWLIPASAATSSSGRLVETSQYGVGSRGSVTATRTARLR